MRCSRSKLTSLIIAMLGACIVATPATAQKAPAKRTTATTAATGPAVVHGGISYANREDAMQFADDVASRRNLDRDWFNPAPAR